MAKKPPQVRFIVRNIIDEDDDNQEIGPEVPDRIFAQCVLAAFEDIIADQLPRGWDAPPQFGLLYQRARTPLQASSAHGLHLEWLPIPDATRAMMEAERPHHVLVNLADSTRRLPAAERAAMFPDDLMAIGILNEGWMLASPENSTKEEMDALQRLADNRMIHQAPERVEVKLAHAVDINGVRYLYSRPRDPAHKPTSIVGLSGQSGLAGDVPNALQYVLEAMQGRDLPDWEEWWTTHHDYRPRDGR